MNKYKYTHLNHVNALNDNQFCTSPREIFHQNSQKTDDLDHNCKSVAKQPDNHSLTTTKYLNLV